MYSFRKEGQLKSFKRISHFLTLFQSIINLVFKETSSSRVLKIQWSLLKQVFLSYALDLWDVASIWKDLFNILRLMLKTKERLSYFNNNTASSKSFQLTDSCCPGLSMLPSYRARRQSPPSRQASRMECLLHRGVIAPSPPSFNSVMLVSFQNTCTCIIRVGPSNYIV